jgi:hypothetical protein
MDKKEVISILEDLISALESFQSEESSVITYGTEEVNRAKQLIERLKSND